MCSAIKNHGKLLKTYLLVGDGSNLKERRWSDGEEEGELLGKFYCEFFGDWCESESIFNQGLGGNFGCSLGANVESGFCVQLRKVSSRMFTDSFVIRYIQLFRFQLQRPM